jgi:tetratricopeptide (TPR) repeat protein
MRRFSRNFTARISSVVENDSFLAGDSAAEGTAILGDAPGPIGLYLFRIARLFSTLARTDVRSAAEAQVAAEFKMYLDRTPSIIAPGDIQTIVASIRVQLSVLPCRSKLAKSCEALGRWAIEQRLENVALTYFIVTAALVPLEPRIAWELGRRFRNSGRWTEAEQWLVRARNVATKIRDRKTQCLAYHSLGNLHHYRGTHAGAETYLAKALRVAERYGLRMERVNILADRVGVLLEGHDINAAKEVITDVLDSGQACPSLLPNIAHDAAQVLLQANQYHIALPIVRSLPESGVSAGNRIRAYASLSHAAGGCGLREEFATSWDTVWREIGSLPSDLRIAIPSVLMELERAARVIGDYSRAENAKSRAIESSRSLGISTADREFPGGRRDRTGILSPSTAQLLGAKAESVLHRTVSRTTLSEGT